MISAPVMAHRIPSIPMISGRMTRSSPLAISPLIREKIIAGKGRRTLCRKNTIFIFSAIKRNESE